MRPAAGYVDADKPQFTLRFLEAVYAAGFAAGKAISANDDDAQDIDQHVDEEATA